MMWKHKKSLCKTVTTKLVFQYTFIMYDCITKYRYHRTAAETQPSSSLLCFDLNVMLVGKFDDVHDVQQEHAVFQSGRLLWICISWAKCGDGGVGEHLPAGSCNNLHCVNRETPSNLTKILEQTPVVGDLQQGTKMLKKNVIFHYGQHVGVCCKLHSPLV